MSDWTRREWENGVGGERGWAYSEEELGLDELVKVVETGHCKCVIKRQHLKRQRTHGGRGPHKIVSSDVPSGAPSHTTRSASSPRKWPMICSAVLVLVMSPSICTTPGSGACTRWESGQHGLERLKTALGWRD